MEKKGKEKKFFMVRLTVLCVFVAIGICSFFVGSGNLGTVKGESKETKEELVIGDENGFSNDSELEDGEWEVSESIELDKTENIDNVNSENMESKGNYSLLDETEIQKDNNIMSTFTADKQSQANAVKTVITSKDTKNLVVDPGQVNYTVEKYSNSDGKTQEEEGNNRSLLSGKVRTESISGEHFAIVNIINVLDVNDKRTVTTRNNGTFEVEIPFGIYDITIEKAGYFKDRIKDVKVDTKTVELLESILVAGDTNSDGIIDFIDLTSVNVRIGLTRQDINYDVKYDFNTDGVIDGRDKEILEFNYGKRE